MKVSSKALLMYLVLLMTIYDLALIVIQAYHRKWGGAVGKPEGNKPGSNKGKREAEGENKEEQSRVRPAHEKERPESNEKHEGRSGKKAELSGDGAAIEEGAANSPVIPDEPFLAPGGPQLAASQRLADTDASGGEFLAAASGTDRQSSKHHRKHKHSKHTRAHNDAAAVQVANPKIGAHT
ncbi:hypothetical protein PAPHI01_1430 [Pancytospora philotis]|nr:hypothetical protein PAPHI01_1430 [Pancytospora philotis]